MGTPDFSVGTLKAIVEAGHEVAAVVTQPDKPKGRGGAMSFSDVKQAAIELGLLVLQPKRARDEAVWLAGATPSFDCDGKLTRCVHRKGRSWQHTRSSAIRQTGNEKTKHTVFLT